MKSNSFVKNLSEYGFVKCINKVIIVPPSLDSSGKEKVWTLLITDNTSDVVVAWYKTRETARQHAKFLRQALGMKR